MDTTRLVLGSSVAGYSAAAILFVVSLAAWVVVFSGPNLSVRSGAADRTKPPEILEQQPLADDSARAAVRRDEVPPFMGLGDLPGGSFLSIARCVSRDGSVVAGFSVSEAGMEAFRWTRDGGMVGLGSAFGCAVNADGSVVVGCRTVPLARRSEPVRWTQAGGSMGLGSIAGCTWGEATGVSADGFVVVGSCGPHHSDQSMAFRWTQPSGMEPLDPLPHGVLATEACGVSSDGEVVVGTFQYTSGRRAAFRWTPASGYVALGTLPGDTDSMARAVSSDGSVVVGCGTREAFVWTRQDGMAGLGQMPGAPPGGSGLSIANAVSADGSVIVGRGWTKSKYWAVIWDATHTMRTVRDLLETQDGLAEHLAGWTLTAARAVSADGHVVVGLGVNPQGNREAWIARLPDSPEENNATMNLAGRAPAVGVDPAQ